MSSMHYQHWRMVIEVAALKQIHKLLVLFKFVGNGLSNFPLMATRASLKCKKLILILLLHMILWRPVTPFCLFVLTLCTCYYISAEWLRVPKNGIKRLLWSIQFH